MTNPFRDLHEMQHCTGWYAKTADGAKTTSYDSQAVAWCATGILDRAQVECRLQSGIEPDFHYFLLRKYGSNAVELNDYGLKSFAWFAEKWDEFIKERKGK